MNPYGASVANVDQIRAAQVNPVAVSSFTSSKPGSSSIGCRAAGPVETADKSSFESYIEKAFIDELKLAGVYDPNSPLVINGHLEELDFNSSIGAGKWIMRLAVSTKEESGYTVESIHEFSTNWVADKACQQVAQAFAPAVQSLISKLVSDPRFQTLVK
ncbi:MAG: hypothetical protein CME36_15820 [unclassified Hahellaceae]|nr:hypothetical protein [Hahellaceae bacterium]